MAEKSHVSQPVPTSVTVEITSRSRTRCRSRTDERVRLSVTYRLENPEGQSWDEASLSHVMRCSVHRALQAYRLSRIPPAQQSPAPPLPVSAVVPAVSIDPDATESDAVVEADSYAIKESALAEAPAPRKRTGTQMMTLEIMARQLDIVGQALTDLLGLRYNKTLLEELTYREAAGLIAHFSGLLRQRLQKEREATDNELTANHSNYQGETALPDAR